jgi:hypothetical protein
MLGLALRLSLDIGSQPLGCDKGLLNRMLSLGLLRDLILKRLCSLLKLEIFTNQDFESFGDKFQEYVNLRGVVTPHDPFEVAAFVPYIERCHVDH